MFKSRILRASPFLRRIYTVVFLSMDSPELVDKVEVTVSSRAGQLGEGYVARPEQVSLRRLPETHN